MTGRSKRYVESISAETPPRRARSPATGPRDQLGDERRVIGVDRGDQVRGRRVRCHRREVSRIRTCKVLPVVPRPPPCNPRGHRCDSPTRSRSSPAPAAAWAASPPSCSPRRARRSSSPSTARRPARETVDHGARPKAARRRTSRPTSPRRPTRRRWSTTRSRPTAGSTCLYNNAGIMPEADHSVIDTDVDTWDQVMAVNVRGVVPRLQVRDPGDGRRRGRLDHQHRELRRDPRLLASRRTPTPPRRGRSCR